MYRFAAIALELNLKAAQQIVGVVALSAALMRVRADPWGSLRAGDSAAQLNSMLGSPNI